MAATPSTKPSTGTAAMIDDDDLDAMLGERETRYGDFVSHARVSQSIKSAMQHSRNWKDLRDCQKEALDMVAHKIARILNGDPEYHDNWFDILGYVRLVEKSLPRPRGDRRKRPQKSPPTAPDISAVPLQLELPLGV